MDDRNPLYSPPGTPKAKVLRKAPSVENLLSKKMESFAKFNATHNGGSGGHSKYSSNNWSDSDFKGKGKESYFEDEEGDEEEQEEDEVVQEDEYEMATFRDMTPVEMTVFKNMSPRSRSQNYSITVDEVKQRFDGMRRDLLQSLQ